MGTAAVQGELWGARASEWAEVQEPHWRPIYREALVHAGVGKGKRLLDVGCGAGGALLVARELGAEPSGFDASERLLAVARQRLPEARFEVGEMEELPFPDQAFDVVTGFNSFQFAGDVVRALAEARRVCRKDGRVLMLVWGRREDCELISGIMPAVAALMPPALEPARPSFEFGVAGVIEELMERAGLVPVDSGEQEATFRYPDRKTAIRAISSAGPCTVAGRHSGGQALTTALENALGPFTRPDGFVEIRNRFRRVIASPA
jgi:SAM-dependent methyltransferase